MLAEMVSYREALYNSPHNSPIFRPGFCLTPESVPYLFYKVPQTASKYCLA